MKRSHILWRILSGALLGLTMMQAGAQSTALSAEEARSIAKEAYTYGFPLVDNYRILHSYFVDRANPEFKSPWNGLTNIARVYTPNDRTIQSPNSDTPYSFLGADLRAEPLVLTLPAVGGGRYFSAQFIDLYTFNFAYAGSRATGSDGGNFLLAGPGWHGETPPGIKAVFRSETELALVLYRTQLFDAGDIGEIEKVQAGYKVQTLSRFLGKPAPAAAPAIDFVKPLDPKAERTSPAFFDELNFVLRFCPTHPSEQALMKRFARLGIGAGKRFDADALTPEIRAAVEAGITDAWQANTALQKQVSSGEVRVGDMVGTREHVKNNYAYRMLIAAGGIYGNSQEEAFYRVYYFDNTGQKPDASQHRYVLRFAPGELPPVKAFWSLTMYDLPAQLLVANPLNRYLINSAMLPALKRDADGGLTFYIQHDSPGSEREANWLPAPDGPIKVALRLYWPEQRVLSGEWKAPQLQRAD